MTRHLISARELATRLALSVRTVRSLASEGRIPSIRFGKRMRFDWEAVLEALRRAKGGSRAS